MKTSLNEQIALDFVKLGDIVVSRNYGCLGKCLEMFSQLLGTPHMHKFINEEKYI